MPMVLSREEVQLVFASLDGVPLLVCSLLYEAGLRLFEALSLRVKMSTVSARRSSSVTARGRRTG